MGLSREMFRPKGAEVAFSKTNLCPSKLKREDGYEPFVNPEHTENPLFVNLYDGHFAQQMELDREGVERVLKTAHLDGKVALASMPFSRTRSEENPLYKVASVPEGWRIEINDGTIFEDLNREGLTGKKLQKEFVKKFNKLLNKSLFECVLKEKLTKIKDKDLVRKAIYSVGNPGVGAYVFRSGLAQLDLIGIVEYASAFFASNAFINLLDTHASSRSGRKLDAHWEHIMPQVEIDKVARAWAFLSLKGRNLVRETKPQAK